MRKVIYSECEYIKACNRMELVEKEEAVFHSFGVSYEEFETGAGNYSTAIIERKDVQLVNIPVERVKFID